MYDFNLDEIELELIFLDPENPRIPKSLHGQSEIDILKYMVENASVIELINSIGENSFFPGEPIILVEESGKYKVVEGNRRVSALKLLQDPALAKSLSRKTHEAVLQAECRPTKIPSLIANNEKDVHKFLGFRHITGVKNWNALEKARYLHRLQGEILGDKPDIHLQDLYYELAKSIGSRSDYVRRVLTAYTLYLIIEENNFFNINGLDDTTFYFVNLSDSLNRTNIANFLGVNYDNDKPIDNIKLAEIQEWTKWLYEKNSQFKTRVKGTSSQLSMLNDIVVNPVALQAFRDGKTLEEAIFLTQHIENIFNDSIKKGLYYLQEADNMVHKMDAFYENIDDDLKEIVTLCRKIKTIKDQKKGEDFEF